MTYDHLMTNKEAIEELKKVDTLDMPVRLCEAYYMSIKALEQEPKTGWNNHQIACMLADLFGDACACNYNGIDEWLSEVCDFKDTCCPNPVGVACWEQFLKYSQSRYTECGYEVRDKNALQEPKTGHWIQTNEFFINQDGQFIYKFICSECKSLSYFRKSNKKAIGANVCPNCGARMAESEE